MSDPHIDIDEIDTRGTSAKKESGRPIPNEEWDGRTETDRVTEGYNAGDMFSNMSQQFRRWQERMMPGAGMGNNGDFGLIPNEATRHLRNSQREFLLAWRSLIDSSLERLERQDLREQIRNEADISPDAPRRGSNKIVVEEFED